jgi:ribosomal protein L32E
MKNQKIHKKGKQREVGREEGRRNENLPPSQIWRRRLGFQEKRRERAEKREPTVLAFYPN